MEEEVAGRQHLVYSELMIKQSGAASDHCTGALRGRGAESRVGTGGLVSLHVASDRWSRSWLRAGTATRGSDVCIWQSSG